MCHDTIATEKRVRRNLTPLPAPHITPRESFEKNTAGRCKNAPHLCCGTGPERCREMSENMPAEHGIKRAVRKRQRGHITADRRAVPGTGKGDCRRRNIHPDRIPAPRPHRRKCLAIAAPALKHPDARGQRRQFRRRSAPPVAAQGVVRIPAGHSRTATPRDARYSFTSRMVISP